jgi:hypothetical protein
MSHAHAVRRYCEFVDSWVEEEEEESSRFMMGEIKKTPPPKCAPMNPVHFFFPNDAVLPLKRKMHEHDDDDDDKLKLKRIRLMETDSNVSLPCVKNPYYDACVDAQSIHDLDKAQLLLGWATNVHVTESLLAYMCRANRLDLIREWIAAGRLESSDWLAYDAMLHHDIPSWQEERLRHKTDRVTYEITHLLLHARHRWHTIVYPQRQLALKQHIIGDLACIVAEYLDYV